MPKKLNFAAILNSKFRWPTGDVPFVEAADPTRNAPIAEDSFARLVFLIDGYKLAADLAVAHCAESLIDRHSLVYPIIFNYRHFIELWLKYLLLTFGRPVGIAAIWDSHDLNDLWGEFRKMLDLHGTPCPDSDAAVAAVVAQFANVDPISVAYRYPFDKKGQELSMAFTSTDLGKLADDMDAVSNYFSGCDGWLTSLQ